MKKVIFSIALFTTVFSFAQKDELKTLKKLYAKDKLTIEEYSQYKETVAKLESLATLEEDKISVEFYKGMFPLLQLSTLGEQPSPAQIAKIMNPLSLTQIVNGLKNTLNFEAKSGKKVYTDDIHETLNWFKPMLQQSALMLNDAKKFKEASVLFYDLYQLDTNDVANLENAAILAVQGNDFDLGSTYYKEIQKVGFKGTGLQKFQSTELDVAKIIAYISFQKKDYEQAKKDYALVNQLNSDDVESQINEANCYYFLNDLTTYKAKISAVLAKDPNNATLQFNVGYLMLSDDAKLVEEINANLKNDKKYNELTAKRKEMFKNAMPYFEKSYQLDASNADCKVILKTCYEILGMKDKATTLK